MNKKKNTISQAVITILINTVMIKLVIIQVSHMITKEEQTLDFPITSIIMRAVNIKV